MGASVGEVENGFGVDGVAHKTRFEVEVRPRAASGVACQCNGLSGFHILVGFHKEARKVTIHGFEAVFVAHNHIESIAAALVFGEAHPSAKGSVDGVANACANVHAFVHTFESWAIAVV